jgi:flagellar motor component MotA
MTLEGVISILEGMNPRAIEGKLLGFLETRRLKHDDDKVAV